MTENEREALQRLLARQPRRGITRRDLLRRMGIGAGALSMTAVMAACGIGGETADQGDSDGDEEEQDTYTTDEITGTLNFANWPLYIDRAKGKRPTIEDFQNESGISVNYQEVIEDNDSFFGTIRQQLSAGQPIEWDLIVVTDWLIERMARLGYLEKLDHAHLGNFDAHAGGIYKDPVYDPGNQHSIPWQAGITGIAYNSKLVEREITSVEDLFDPAFAGRVGMLSEMLDTMDLTLLGLGVDLLEATEADAQRAQQKLLEQRDDGIVREYFGNEYADALVREDIVISMAWSGDIFQLKFDKPELEFVVPDEGGILWVDSMAIPQNAAHPIDALEFMNYVYQPEVAAQITAWVNYICPVPEAQPILAAADDGFTRQVAESPLVFPTPEMEARLHSYRTLTEDELMLWNDLFNQVIQG